MQDMSGRQDKYLILREDGINRIIIVFHAVNTVKQHRGRDEHTRAIWTQPGPASRQSYL